MKNILIAGALACAACLLPAPQAFGQTSVTVYGEGQYNDTELTVSLYADISSDSGAATDNLISAGLSLHFDPSQLQVATADKDESVWYMGDPTGTTYGYFQPVDHVTVYTDQNGKQMAYVPIMCGKLDTRAGHPLDGVAPGAKIPLGHVTFSYPAGSAMPATPATLTIKHVKPNGDGSFKSFVTVGKVVLDDIAGAVNYSMVALTREPAPCPGDINGDNRVNLIDFSFLRRYWGKTGPDIPADLNQDGQVNIRDFNVLRANWGNVCP